MTALIWLMVTAWILLLAVKLALIVFGPEEKTDPKEWRA